MTPRSSLVANERGAALIMAMLIAMLLTALGTVLIALTTTETALSASYRHVQEARYGAEAALELVVADLSTISDWSEVIAAPPANRVSRFSDATLTPRAPSGRTLDLTALTLTRQHESDARDGPDRFGANSPQWRLFLHVALADVLPVGGPSVPLHLIAWVADDGLDGDGNAALDANQTIVVHAEVYGTSHSTRAMESALTRDGSRVRVIARRAR